MACTIIYGALYNWYAATDAREIISAGWHIPTSTELNTLRTYAGGLAVAGTKLRESGTTYWNSGSGFIEGTNDYGFNCRGAGVRDFSAGYFYAISNQGMFWCSDANPYGYYFYTLYNINNLYLFDLSEESWKSVGFSIRPIKDSTTLTHGQTGTYTGNDGKVYRTICIGTQEWLADNLAETKYRDGSDIPIVTDNAAWAALETGAMCYYNNDIDNAIICTADEFCVNAKYIKFGICIAPDPPLDPSIRAFWQLEEAFGSSIVYDTTDNHYDGTVNGATLGVSGHSGNAAYFDGSGDYIDCGATVGDLGLSNFSISVWLYLNSPVNTFNGICGNYGSTYPYFYITVGDSAYEDKIVAHFVVDSSTDLTVTSDSAISISTWIHCIVIFDRSGTIDMYIDNVLQAEQTNISAYSATSMTNDNAFNLGNIGSARGGYYGDLILDSVQITEYI